MFRFRCQCLGFVFGLLLSMGVSAATVWLPTDQELGLFAREAGAATSSLMETAAIPSPLPLILMASGLLGLVYIAHRR